MSLRAPSRHASITVISWLIALALLGDFAAVLRQAEAGREAEASAAVLSGRIQEHRSDSRELSESDAAMRDELREAVALRKRLADTRRANDNEVVRLESEIARLEAEIARLAARPAEASTPPQSAPPRPLITLCVPSSHQHSPPVCSVWDPN